MERNNFEKYLKSNKARKSEITKVNEISIERLRILRNIYIYVMRTTILVKFVDT